MITIVDYDTGNLRSVINALRRLGAGYSLSSDPKEIAAAEKIVLPGVGEAATAMEKLRERGLVQTLRQLTQPVLGICLGMQLMCRRSEEGDTECLGIFDNTVRRFAPPLDMYVPETGVIKSTIKVPHMGWNDIMGLKSALYKSVPENSFVYYVHSYAADINEDTIATTFYVDNFSSSIRRNNFYGAQFHPEKSGAVGEKILKNFLEL